MCLKLEIYYTCGCKIQQIKEDCGERGKPGHTFRNQVENRSTMCAECAATKDQPAGDTIHTDRPVKDLKRRRTGGGR